MTFVLKLISTHKLGNVSRKYAALNSPYVWIYIGNKGKKTSALYHIQT